MPRIDPFQLLKCLSVLLGPAGGIKSKEEVHRLANLMTKFSKKLVSKCIYIQILKTTNTELLSQFMDAGGWSLVHMWLTDGIVAKNWALIQELLELLHLCPVKIDRLKSNNCPKLIKGLSKEVCHQGVRLLATRLVEQWLKIVKGEAAPNSVPAQIIGNIGSQTMIENSTNETEHYEVSSETSNDRVGNDSTTVQVEDLEQTTANYRIETNQSQQPLQLHILNNPAVQQQQVQHITKQSFVVVGNGTSVIPSGPVCKITIRDGNQVLVKVETDASNINNALNSNHEMNGDIADSEITDNRDNEGDYDDMTIERLDDDYEGAVNQASSDVKQQTVSTTKNLGNHEVTSKDAGVKETKENNSIGDGNKSSDKENRDSHKTDDKKSSGSSSNSSEKKSHHGSTKSGSSSSSSKHGSSSHRTSSSSSHRSSHRSGSGSSSRSSSSKDKSSRDKDRHHSSSSSKHGSSSSSSSKNKSERDKEREKEREKLKKDQADKDKATLEKVQAQAISSKLGKIPKKKTEDEKTPGDSLLRKSSTDSRESSKENKDKSDPKKSAVAGAASVLEKKNISISIENRKNSQDSARPKTVKTFNSKFRSTGLEEEVKPPPPRSAAKKTAGNILDKKILPAKPLSTLKRTSPLRETTGPSDKRARLSLDPPLSSPTEEKKGAIKLISPKPKPMVLQESDMFMDALMTASTKSKEPRKRKRRTSVSKDGSTDSKKSESSNADGGHDSPSQHPSSPLSAEDRSPLALKPNFKFYQDTLETDEDKEEKQEQLRKEKEDESDETKLDADGNEDYETSISNLVKTEMAAMADKAKEVEEDPEETKAPDSPERDGTNAESGDFPKKERSVSPIPEIRYIDGLRSVLLLQKRKGPKKNLKWKTELESIRYFELDETERVNVTKTFTDMKQMEKQNEREAFQMARKLSNEDLMEEKTRWKPLIPIDLMPALVEPGKDSREKEIQYAREKGILQALYFNRSMIPDSALEPDEERHHVMTDPKVIPLEDLTGNKESEKDFTNVPWPEPKLQVPPPVPSMPPPGYHFPAGFPHSQPPMLPTMGLPGAMGSMPPMQQGPMMGAGPMNHMGGDMGVPMGATPVGGAGWRTGDGKVVVPDVGMNPMQPPMPNMPAGFPPGMDGPMGPPGMMRPPMFNQQEGFGMIGPEEMGYANFQGPPGPGMYGPGQNFPGGPPRGGGPMHGGNRGRGAGPGWFRGGGVTGGPMLPRMGTGGGSGGGGWRAGWRGNGKQPPICRQFTKNGFCRVGDKCQYLHPGVNCPPF